jgi:hypothetical protein
MSIFGDILNKIFHTQAQAAPTPQPQKTSAPKAAPSGGTAPSPATQQNSKEPVDVEKVLTDLAAKKGGGGNWRTSVVDLLKLLDLDSSLTARKELAKELNVRAGADGFGGAKYGVAKSRLEKTR